LPLPQHVSAEKVLNFIHPTKDVDGLHPFNIGAMALRKHNPYFVSCTPLGVIELIMRSLPPGETLAGKKVCIIGRSNIVGMPLSLLLNKHDA